MWTLKHTFLKKKFIYGNLIEKLRYGENPHQMSAIYSENTSLKINKTTYQSHSNQKHLLF